MKTEIVVKRSTIVSDKKAVTKIKIEKVDYSLPKGTQIIQSIEFPLEECQDLIDSLNLINK
jgi:hypothetical protein